MSAASLQAIRVYPIKSSAGISLSTSWIDELGLSFDRRFVLSRENGQFLTGRTDAKICLIRANITASGFILTAPGMPPLTIRYQDFSQDYRQVTVWKNNISALHCHNAYDLWFSQYLGKSCRLYYFGEDSRRAVKRRTEQVAFADGYPLMMISRASLQDLNRRTPEPFTMANFRPNLIIDNCEAFAEDTWSRIRIGEVEFDLPKPCTRCIFTTVDPKTGIKHPQMEPLNTLKGYRRLENGDVAFGYNLVPLNQGQVSVNDEIRVLERHDAPVFIAGKVKSEPATVPAEPSQADKRQDFPLVCRKIIRETHDVKSFILTPEQGKASDIRYQAGQHLPLTLNLAGKKVNATYTLSSSPTRSGSLMITVKRVPGGLVSNYLHDEFRVGDTLNARTPAGKFHINSADISKVLLLSAGSGITPMLSMLKAMTDQALDNDVVFFHSARSEQDLIAREEVAALALHHGNCRVSYTLTRSASPQWTDYQGHLNSRMLAKIPDLAQRQVFVCGPAAFRDNAKQLLLSLGLPESAYHFESFGAPKKPVQEQSGQTSPEQANKPKTPKKVSILFDSWDKQVTGNNSEPLLDQGEAAGLILPYSCRGGMCGSCKVKLESGEVEQLASDGLTDNEKKQGYILACSCIPTTDIVISQG
ncbi:MOSC domain-containing protein [Thalassomonas viridans]|uniref:MOSC domain-containing protein n=1 Tax=Thalassomonas viridans TaxID=137584 RepID=A0AAF0CA04_9GAMM|nr:hybrid-cluster NAD(P)-dependent oxidoreductase [Thalassomonas viridans]WDE05775.1 MOSC domain-containing protein [Thalassomonas viridans]